MGREQFQILLCWLHPSSNHGLVLQRCEFLKLPCNAMWSELAETCNVF